MKKIMPKINLQGTEFEFSVLPLKLFSNGFWARTKISIKNEFVSYSETGEMISRDELEKWIFSMFRLLAGAYGQERSLGFEKAGFAVDLYPFMKEGLETTRTERRENDCVMVVRLLMRSSDKKTLLGGVYSLLFHRQEIEEFALALRKEFDAVFEKFVRGRGKHLFVGVSPFGFSGCNYWYLDETDTVKQGDYVWVTMGRHKLEQIVFVDSVRRCDEDDAPYPLNVVKKIIRKATGEEIENLNRE